MMSNVQSHSAIVNNPKNFAAVYARISGKKDNNSINAQIELATTALNKNNLIVYDTYTDFDSAKKLSPTKRKGLSKLLADAKAGCFKTVIIYRLDRLVRNYKDWLEIKTLFSKLNITLIYSDNTQSFALNSPQGEFFENLMVMVAEMEPDTIKLRASNGRKVRRLNGAYSSGVESPFGYTREIRAESDSNKDSKSIFIKEPVKLAFVKYIYSEFYNLINKDEKSLNTNSLTIISLISTKLKDSIDFIEKNISRNSIPLLSLSTTSPLYELYTTINQYLLEDTANSVSKAVAAVKYHYLIDKESNKKRNTNNINNSLKMPIYAGYMLEDSNHPFKGLKYNSSDSDNVIYYENLDEEAFIKTNNISGVIPFEIFKAVYSYITYDNLGRIDRTPDFLLKNILKCSCNKKLRLVDDSHLHCGNNSCTSFLKIDLLTTIVSEIVSDCLSNSDTTLDNFLKSIKRRIDINTLNINSYRKKKFEAVANYINFKDDYSIDAIYNSTSSIDSYLSLSTQCRQKIDSINTLSKEINTLNTKYTNSNNDSVILSNINSKITDYILSNEEKFIPIFSEIIKEVKVILKNDCANKKGNIKITYEFKPEKHSNLH